MKQISKIIAVVFHPVLMPLVGAFILLNSGIFESNVPLDVKKYIYLSVGLFSILLPLAFLPLLNYWKVVKSMELNDRRERFIPLIFTATSLVLLNIVLSKILPFKLMNAYTFAIATVSVLLLFANFALKISIHLTALGGITGLIIILTVVYDSNMFYWLLIVTLLSGIVASARLFTSSHTLGEVSVGYLMGLVATSGLMFMYVS